MDEIEKKARELLAAEYAKHGVYGGVNTRYSEIDTAAVAAIAAALRSAQVPDARAVIEQCREALGEELSQWDIDPPIAHVKDAYDACSAWLAAAPSAEGV